jgi:hypothetical protein
MIELFEYGDGDTGFPQLNPLAAADLRALPNSDHVRVFLAVDHEMGGVAHNYGPGEEMLAGRAKQIFGLAAQEALAEHQRALAGLKAEPGLLTHPTDALAVLATWAKVIRVGGHTILQGTGNWRTAAITGAIPEMLRQLTAATDSDGDFDARVDLAVEIITAVDNWMLAQWAAGTAQAPALAAAEEAVVTAVDDAIFDHILDIAIGEVATWTPDLGHKQPGLYRASRVWAILAAREETVRGTTDPAANILARIK